MPTPSDETEPTGVCTIGTDSVPGFTREDCEGIGGTFTPGGGGAPGMCAVRTIIARALGDNILRLGSSYTLTYKFRDEILSKSAVGRRLLKHYYDHSDELYAIVCGSPEILIGAMQTWNASWGFIAQMLVLCDSKVKDDKLVARARKAKYTKAQFTTVSRTIKSFSKATQNQGLRTALKEGEVELSKYVGLNAEQALTRLRK